MKPVDLEAEGHKDVIVFAEHQPQYESLPAVLVEPGVVWTRWQLSEDERRAIMDGARIELWVWTFGKALQPVMLAVEGVQDNSQKDRKATNGVTL